MVDKTKQNIKIYVLPLTYTTTRDLLVQTMLRVKLIFFKVKKKG